jgi:hypothetical protein
MENGPNEFRHPVVKIQMQAILLSSLFVLSLVTFSTAQTCREVIRDASGRIVQTIEHQQQAASRA